MDNQPQPQSGGMAPAYLGELSALAARTYDSTEALMESVLTLVVGQLGMRTSFLTQLEHNQLCILATHNEPGGCDLRADTAFPLEDTF